MEHGVRLSDLKSAVGKSIFLIPQHNAVKNKLPIREQIQEEILLKCGNKKAEVGNSFIGSFYIDGEKNSNNFGYLPFLAKEDALKYLEKLEFIFELKYTNLMHLNDDDIKKIKEIVFKERGINEK